MGLSVITPIGGQGGVLSRHLLKDIGKDYEVLLFPLLTSAGKCYVVVDGGVLWNHFLADVSKGYVVWRSGMVQHLLFRIIGKGYEVFWRAVISSSDNCRQRL